MKVLYVYRITNNITGKIYIGKHSSSSVVNNYYGSGVAIKASIKKHGISNFTKDIICTCATERELNDMEIYHIEDSGAFKFGYNMTRGGEGKLGYKPTDEQKARQSATMIKFFAENPDVRAKISKNSSKMTGSKNGFFGKKLTKEHIDKMTAARVKAITGGANPSAVRLLCVESGAEFDTAKDAAAYCGLKHSTTVLKAAKGQRNKAGGYTWRIL